MRLSALEKSFFRLNSDCFTEILLIDQITGNNTFALAHLCCRHFLLSCTWTKVNFRLHICSFLANKIWRSQNHISITESVFFFQVMTSSWSRIFFHLLRGTPWTWMKLLVFFRNIAIDIEPCSSYNEREILFHSFSKWTNIFTHVSSRLVYVWIWTILMLDTIDKNRKKLSQRLLSRLSWLDFRLWSFTRQ